MSEVNYSELLAHILEIIYWPKFTTAQQTAIINIIKDSNFDNLGKANEICEFLEIEKRGNRSAFVSALNGYCNG